MKKLTNKKAFTLTELIVVIVIIGILAAVLVPSLTGYIEKAKANAAVQEAGAYKTAYATWLIEKDVTKFVTTGDPAQADQTTANSSFNTYVRSELKFANPVSVTITLSSVSGKVGEVLGFTCVIDEYTVTYVHATGSLTAQKVSS